MSYTWMWVLDVLCVFHILDESNLCVWKPVEVQLFVSGGGSRHVDVKPGCRGQQRGRGYLGCCDSGNSPVDSWTPESEHPVLIYVFLVHSHSSCSCFWRESSFSNSPLFAFLYLRHCSGCASDVLVRVLSLMLLSAVAPGTALSLCLLWGIQLRWLQVTAGW